MRSGQYPDRLLADVTDEREFVAEIVYGVTRWRRELEWLVQRYSHRPPSPEIAAILMAGIYQLRHMDSVPAYAAVNETVAAGRKTAPYAAGYINRVLRDVDRDSAEIEKAIASAPLGVRASHPDILIERWGRRFGLPDTEALCRWDNTRPETVLHVDTSTVGFRDLREQLSESGIDAAPHPAFPETCLSLPPGTRPDRLPGYAEGLFTIRDPSTSLAVELLSAQPGERVLDACAAPGGKTVMLAQQMSDRGKVIAVDASASRLERIHENIGRMNLTCVEVLRADASRRDRLVKAIGEEPFDRILLDVPCTNTGVLRRRPDARWRFSEDALRAAVDLQRRILSACAPLLKPGGTLVYSTCSLEEEEGTGLVREWLASASEFTIETEHLLFPPRDGCDGAFVAKIRRRTC
jgi:16S rRNA (cytosine967-C5)-methyltransferase